MKFLEKKVDAFPSFARRITDKINEIIGFNTSTKEYYALLTQSSTNAPEVTVLKNTLGGIPEPSFDATGSYYLTLAGAFPSERTGVLIGSYNVSLAFTQNVTAAGINDDNSIYIETYTLTEADAGGNLTKTAANGLLNSTLIMIIVKNS